MKLEDIKNIRRALLIAVVIVALLLIYAYFSTPAGVLDPSNSQALSDQFDQLNPNIPTVSSASNDSTDGDDDSTDQT